ncbi:hypothetical protein [Thalassobium sp. R2A62]|uniref:hypothetical protein n=1 Tax=Thalassobium sp. R2A62 TaxID=633131 RepID=UPI001CBF0FFC|nr:hypothetical protein [Thalassobium sp. R2A62]MDG1339402.1 hypothetical protein [Paracoccaceae bacterium]
MTRRAALSRLGLFATAAYVAPGFSTLSTAGASSVSSASSASSASSVSSASSASSVSSVSSASSASSGASLPSLPSDHSYTAGQVRKYNSCKKTSTTMDDFRTCLVTP